jgi:arylsulfatase A-like enzyme
MRRRSFLIATASSAAALGAAAVDNSALAQTPVAGRELLPIPQDHSRGDTPLDVRDAHIAPIRQLEAPANAPNIVVVLLDDMGYGAPSAFGGPCQMPTAERIAKEGLLYNRFHNTALCSPSRQALHTGRNHHSVNMGSITETATGVPGYTSVLPDTAATIAQMLRLNGYNTAAFGKWHQTPVWETSASGPFDRWPTGQGYEHFYGFIGGEANQWSPTLVDGTTPVETPTTPGYHVSVDLTDRTIAYMRGQKAMTPNRPFFVYLAYGATHAPHHVPKDWIDRNRGKFDQGWDAEREKTFARQKQLGIIPDHAELTARPPEIPAWNDISDDEKQIAARLIETYVAFAEHTDAQVARIVDVLDGMGIADNTIFLYLLGDNGGSGEGGLNGAFNAFAVVSNVIETPAQILPKLDQIGSPLAYNHYPVGWAHAMDTPFQWTKQIASHWGGTRCGMVMRWPAGIKAKGEVRTQWHHFIDVVPTLLEAAKVPAPAFVDGIQQQPIEGVSFAYSFDDPKAADRRTTQYFEMLGNRGIYHDGWMACTKHSLPWVLVGKNLPFTEDLWELYGPDDFSQARNIAAQQPQKLASLQQLFLLEASKYNVFPLDDRKAERLNPDLAGRPDLMKGRTSMTLYPGMTHLNENTVLNIKNKSYTVTAEIMVPPTGASGAIVAQGGRFGGWSLYLRDGVPAHCYNFADQELYYARGAERLAPGMHTIRYEFVYGGGGVGRGGTGTLLVDSKQVAQVRLQHTSPFQFSLDDPMDIGRDSGAPVTDEYGTPGGIFTGMIALVRIDIGNEEFNDAEGRQRSLMMRQ